MKAPQLLRRVLLGLGLVMTTLVLLCGAYIALYGWNWLRAPVERYALHKTGRELAIAGDLTVRWGWPVLRLHAAKVSFANPAWAQERQMVAARGVEVSVSLPQLLQRTVAFPEVRLDQATVFLEQASGGRKSWLLDLAQQDENARITIGRIALINGTLGYDHTDERTRLRAHLSSTNATTGGQAGELVFQVQGRYKDQAVQVLGSGGPVLALRDTGLPYPITLDAAVGPTHLKAKGSITGLLTLAGVDVQMALRGGSLEQLYPLLGIAFPATPAYAAQGYLMHIGRIWRFEQFSGRVGSSDLAGFVQVVTGGKRPVLTADVRSQRLALDDLGTVIGTRAGNNATQAPRPPGPKRVLPDLPFNTERWDSVDAEVQLRAKTLARAKALPLEDLVLHLSLRDKVLTLDPLNFGLAAGELNAKITLDGRTQPIQAHAQVRAKKVLLSKLFPTIDLSKSSMGEIHGEFDLAGSGNSVGTMLATANGKLGLVVSGGQISKLLMEKAGLHLWEIMNLSLTGDKLVKLRCAVADFDVKQGRMQTDALVFDTEITTLLGTGSIDLKQEQLDLTLNPHTKNTSPLSLRSPIYIRGSFAQPRAGVDKGRVVLRAAGAVALGALNPFLALIPLIDAGPGKDSDCGQLVRDAKS
jgi:AsmA protein